MTIPTTRALAVGLGAGAAVLIVSLGIVANTGISVPRVSELLSNYEHRKIAAKHPAAVAFVDALNSLKHNSNFEVNWGHKARHDARKWELEKKGISHRLVGHRSKHDAFSFHEHHSEFKENKVFKDPKWLEDGVPRTMFDNMAPEKVHIGSHWSSGGISLDRKPLKPVRLVDGGIPDDMFRGDKSKIQMLRDVGSRGWNARPQSGLVIENNNGIPELKISDRIRAKVAKDEQPEDSQAAQSLRPRQQHLRQQAPAPQVVAPQPQPRAVSVGSQGVAIQGSTFDDTLYNDQAASDEDHIDTGENEEAMRTLRAAMVDATQKTPGHREPVTQMKRRMSPQQAQQAYDQQQQSTESYFAYKWRLAHES